MRHTPYLLLAGIVALPAGLHAQTPRPNVPIPAPDRGGYTKIDPETHQVIDLDRECPPTTDKGVKNPPDPSNGLDRNIVPTVGNPPVRRDDTPDYFMGSWQYFDQNGFDVRVTKWCINLPETRLPTGGLDHFNDYFTFQIETSSPFANTDDEITKVKPNSDNAT